MDQLVVLRSSAGGSLKMSAADDIPRHNETQPGDAGYDRKLDNILRQINQHKIDRLLLALVYTMPPANDIHVWLFAASVFGLVMRNIVLRIYRFRMVVDEK